MDASEPRLRRRGFFLHSDTTGEPDSGEHENPEGVAVRVRLPRSSRRRTISSVSARSGGRMLGRSRTSAATELSAGREGLPQIRSGSVTGSRQRAHWLR
jgi:hypothetical protein